MKTETAPTVPHQSLDNIIAALRKWLAAYPYTTDISKPGRYDAAAHELYFAKHGCGQWLSITVRHVIEEDSPAVAVARIKVAQELYEQAVAECEKAFGEWMPKS